MMIWYEDIQYIISLNETHKNLLFYIFPYCYVFYGEDSIKSLLSYFNRKRDITDIIRQVNKHEEPDYTKEVEEILTLDCDVKTGLILFKALHVWNKDLMIAADIIYQYPTKDRQRVLDFIDWLWYRNIDYRADFETIFEPIQGVEITEIIKKDDTFDKWLKEWYDGKED